MPEMAIYNPRSVRGMSGNMITAMLEQEPGKIWLGTANDGLNLLDESSNVYRHFRHDSDDPNSLVNNYVTYLYRDRKARIWVGTFDGLDRISERDSLMVFEHFRHDPADSQSISNNNIYCMMEDQSGRLWIGTSNGLNLFDPVNQKFRRYNIENGLPNAVICGILEDNSGKLWLSTQKGISRFDPQTETFNNFDLTHGLQSNMFNVGACLKLRTHQMLFGGINGFNLFKADKIKINTHVPPVSITAFKVFNKEMRFNKAIHTMDRIELSYRQNFFTIEFAALDYHAPEKNEYAFKLEGVDPGWSLASNKNYASYTNLDPGSYTFRVKGSNNDGIWNETGRNLFIRIQPPFWMSWWFRLMVIVASLVIITAVIFDIRQRAERKTRLNKRIAELKLQALRAQMNPHFIFNTINAIQYFITFNDQKSAYSYLSLFSKLLRMTLDNSEKSTIPISDEIMRLKLYLELQLLRFDDMFAYTIQVDKSIDQHNLEIPPMLIQPYVENAIKHGISSLDRQGRIDVSMNMNGSFLICEITDNGIGINKSIQEKQQNHHNHHASMAMRVTEERLDIINAAHKNNLTVDITDLSETGSGLCGTKVIIHIPV
jgi:hypothetical protein